MAANKMISLNDVNRTIDFTFAASDQQRGAALGALQRVLCAELVPLAREQVRLTEKFGADDPRVVMIAEQIEINQAFMLEVAQETDRAQNVVALVDVNTWVLQGFVRDDAGKGLPNLTVALYDSIKPDAHWVKGLGYVCTDANG